MPTPTVQLGLRLDPGLYDRLDEYCRESGQTKRLIIESLLRTFLDSLPTTRNGFEKWGESYE